MSIKGRIMRAWNKAFNHRPTFAGDFTGDEALISEVEQYWKDMSRAFNDGIKSDIEKIKKDILRDHPDFSEEDAKLFAEGIVEFMLNDIAYKNWRGPVHMIDRDQSHE